MLRRRSLFLVPAVLAVLVAAPSVQAQPKLPEWEWRQADLRRVAGLSLVYTQRSGVGQCGSAQSFREDLTERLGYSPFGSPSPDQPTIVLALRRLDLSITRTKSHMTATVSGFDSEGKPLFEPRSTTHPRQDCEQLHRMVVAMATDAIRSYIPPLPKADPPAPVQPPAVVPKVEEAPPVRVPFFGLVHGHDLGTAPGVLLGAAIVVGLRWPDFSLALEPSFFFGVEGVGEHQIQARFWAATIAPCVHLGVMFGCGLASFGERRFFAGYGANAPKPEIRNPVFAAVGLRVGLAWPLPVQPWHDCRRLGCPPGFLRITADLRHTPLTTTMFVNKRGGLVLLPPRLRPVLWRRAIFLSARVDLLMQTTGYPESVKASCSHELPRCPVCRAGSWAVLLT